MMNDVFAEFVPPRKMFFSSASSVVSWSLEGLLSDVNPLLLPDLEVGLFGFGGTTGTPGCGFGWLVIC